MRGTSLPVHLIAAHKFNRCVTKKCTSQHEDRLCCEQDAVGWTNYQIKGTADRDSLGAAKEKRTNFWDVKPFGLVVCQYSGVIVEPPFSGSKGKPNREAVRSKRVFFIFIFYWSGWVG
jgi:hypothetical protein